MASEIFLREAGRLIGDGYVPSDETLSVTQTMHVTTVSGITGAGKDTVMKATGLPVVVSMTSRDREARDAPDAYDFISDGEGEERVIEELAAGALVQATLHPTTGQFYGSRLEAFGGAGSHPLMDVLPSQYYKFTELSLFGSVRAAYITPPGYSTWQHRLMARGKTTPEDSERRAKEGISSLETTLNDPNFYFIVNSYLATAAASLRAYAERSSDMPKDTAARLAAQGLFNRLSAQMRRRVVVSDMH